MGRNVDYGVFLPVTNNGWIISKTSPQFLPSYVHNKAIVELAERIGFSYAFSMAKWRGFGGDVEFWKYSLESMTLMTGLAHAAPTLQLFASIAPIMMHPAVFAKMAATMDDISGGRMGFNVVSAGNKGEVTQTGLYFEGFEEVRYKYFTEWVSVVKRLWSEDNVTHKGDFFNLDECQSWPKPIQKQPPFVCATSSENGFEFVAQQCSAALFGGLTLPEQIKMSRRAKEVAAQHHRPDVRTHTLINLIQGDSDKDAERIMMHYESGADTVAIDNIYRLRSRGKGANDLRQDYYRNRAQQRDSRLFYAGVPFVGGPESVADMIEELAVDGDLDGFLFIFPDFIDGLTRFSEQVMPLLQLRGLRRLTPPFAAPAAAQA
jgi:pyrimidine oxygenase